ncbi:tRNA (adenosine(37)-N6)-threonylcarbamoyltransferase complex dimerization subunit type 1 TsaB [Hydrogenophaga laconesensis]|uniref:tRNA threonylcarbamoyladenosine biosynthesis protein TsaB n=1 Tax=Hydrogenophaga laconesensis TaxID=1805971 RepID=A0ABU1V7N7_9BURK|nr:tRNA (adenosine(37)-N6)-threonylcarbamoyltransferase complex dimerization subunit type 1 TsaB [Hydrogenophaga laconesensis]MDR7093395.1 tRNA threonylcarbamoyladenosine biosynthesis protein TsaB [Hydrogenophaga laconesensis]
MPSAPRLLALETSTDTLSVALGDGVPGGALWQHSGPGGALASTTLLPLVRQLLDTAGWAMDSLDAVVFGRGPGSFTGLRTACAVAQGLAYGARPGGLPVLPVDTLLALAEEARFVQQQAGQSGPGAIAALLDARMAEMYVATYACTATGLAPLAPPRLCAPPDLGTYLREHLPAGRPALLAGNVFETYAPALADVTGERLHALPTASALLRLAPALLAAGAAVPARDALPLYVRDKVAQTTEERERLRATVPTP